MKLFLQSEFSVRANKRSADPRKEQKNNSGRVGSGRVGEYEILIQKTKLKFRV